MAAPAYDEPRIRCAAVLPLGEGLVVVAHSKDGVVYHLLPGGGVAPGESLRECIRREVAEETGLHCRILRPLAINDSIDPVGGRHVVNLTFLCEVTGGAITDDPKDPRVAEVLVAPWPDLHRMDLRPPMAEFLTHAAASGFVDSAVYLERLWTP